MAKNSQPKYPFQDPNLPVDERVEDLISRLTLEEKISLMPTRQAAVERLGIREYNVGGEAAHGLVAREGPTTVFPQTLGLACTWNPDLMLAIGSAVGDEARAYYKKRNESGGLTLWAPTVDMERDPRWGRTEEAYGEDPHLTGMMSAAYAKGMRGDHPFYIKAVASLKHFYANNNEHERLRSSSSIDPRNKREYYLKAFEPAIRERAAHSMMTAYNEINGTPAICHPDVQEIVKEEWGLDGFIVCDGADLHQTVDDHRYCDTYAEAVALAVKGGIDCITDDRDLVIRALHEAIEQGLLEETDLDRALRRVFRIRFRLGQFDPEERNPYAKISEAVIYRAEHRELALRAAREAIVLLKNEPRILPLDKNKLNSAAVIGPLADVVYRDWYTGQLPYRVTPLAGIAGKISADRIRYADGCDEILLRSAKSGRYVGPHSYDRDELTADKTAGDTSSRYKVTDWGWGRLTLRSMANGAYVTTDDETVSASAQDVWGWFVKEQFTLSKTGQDAEGQDTYILRTWNERPVTIDEEERLVVAGGEEAETEAALFHVLKVKDGIEEAVRAAAASDVAIVCVGNHPLINGKEEIDRPDLVLPEHQQRLIREVYKANPNTIVVVIGSYPFALNWEEEHVPAIVYTAHGGQEAGHALADVLFGDYNPAGRLNMTWYRSVDQLPDMMDYDIIKGGRTYMYFEGEPLYPFGHGLSYTEFLYKDLVLSSDALQADGQLTISVTVENIGALAGDEVVQLYVRANQSRVKRPLKQLAGFKRVHLKPGEQQTITFTLQGEQFAFWDVTRERYAVENGEYTILIGRSSAQIELQSVITVHGETIPPRNLYQRTKAENYDDYEAVYLDECSEGGTCVVPKGPAGSWILFKDADFSRGAVRFEMRAAARGRGVVELRANDSQGELIARLEVEGQPRTNRLGRVRNDEWRTISEAVQLPGSVSDLYLGLSGDVRIAWFCFHA